MIHIAPCDCELHLRIRDLEATSQRLHDELTLAIVRAENAEAWAADAEKECQDAKDRVAELSATLEEGSDWLRVITQERDFLQRFILAKGHTEQELIAFEPLAAIEREREE